HRLPHGHQVGVGLPRRGSCSRSCRRLLDAAVGVRDRRPAVNVVLLCLGVWLLLTPSRWRLRLTGRGRPLVKPQDAAALLAGLGMFVVIGGVWGVLCGVAAGLASRGILERLGDHVPKDTDQVLRLAPEAVDCLAACVAAGAPLWSAMSVVGRCFTGPVG